MFNDHAKAIRQQFLRASSTELARASKLEKAKQYLGNAWVLSPKYNRTSNPAHAAQGSYCLQMYVLRQSSTVVFKEQHHE